MAILLPSVQAERIRSAVVDYLATTFALTDAEPRRALTDFLQHPGHGVFTGPFARLRLPYLPSEGTTALDWTPPFPPYHHQEQAYRRLTSKPLGPAHAGPEATIVTTGTGSGKTEAFLHPILDHVLRAQKAGITGIKALILYPMNALASDQAARLTRLITSDPALGSVRAGLYTGDAETTSPSSTAPDFSTTAPPASHSGTTPDPNTTPAPGTAHTTHGTASTTRRRGSALETDRYSIRRDPPDILLTNYKMLDQLLLRPEDQQLWEASAQSLTYLVLDEFHTYDGAQGTDVAMLLRRLGLAIRSYLSTDDPRLDAFTTSPLGPITPVATSATLGDGNDPAEILDFAREVFGFPLPPEAVITETRVPLEQWAGQHRRAIAPLGLTPRPLRNMKPDELDALAALAEGSAADIPALLHDVVEKLYEGPAPSASQIPPSAQSAPAPAGPAEPTLATPATWAAALQAHPDVLTLIEAAQQAAPVATLARSVLGGTYLEDPPRARRVLAVIFAALSAVRAGLDGTPNRNAVSVEITLWVREVTRIERMLSTQPAFRWSDDAASTYAALEEDIPARPALYCRACGRSGWGITLARTGQAEKPDQSNVRRDHLLHDSRFRALLHAPGEDAAYLNALAGGAPDPAPRFPGLRWYSVARRELLTRRPAESDTETREGRIVPVLVLTGDEVDIQRQTTHDVCPSCGSDDSIRFLGSAVATLLSVSLTTLFGDDALDSAEKRTLIFTDSVQDAAHRAGFVDQRSHTISLRSALRGALDGPMPLDSWVEATISAASDPFDRYRLVPADLAEHQRFRPFWDSRFSRSRRRTAEKYLRRRLLFDSSLEVGLQSTYGRTMEATGSIAVHCDAGSSDQIAAIARETFSDDAGGLLPAFTDIPKSRLLAWVRGTLEHMRRDGAIDHEWLQRYKEDDGARVWIWYKRKRHEGQPAFPAGRSAPAFPQVGGAPNSKRSTFTPVTSAKSWHAIWTHKCLAVSPQHAARLAADLLKRLARASILSSTETDSGGTVYAIPTARIIVSPLEEVSPGRLLLVCDTCRSQLPSSSTSSEQLQGAPCLTAACPGHLETTEHTRTSFYRRQYARNRVRRVDAHEHTSLLAAEERTRIEEGFKRAEQNPGDPNVLVATPTLEMGIDIGDLSTVLLGSLPDNVASYVQRVGRAGRRNGSALALAYVPGRRGQLPLLEDPARLLNGAVEPPSTYLGAEEILRRQFIASVIDSMARSGDPAIPGRGGKRPTARTALGSDSGESLIGSILAHIENDGATLASAFAATFEGALGDADGSASSGTDADGPATDGFAANGSAADQDALPAPHNTGSLTRLIAWATEDHAEGPRRLLERAVAEHANEEGLLYKQLDQINTALPELIDAANLPNATEEDRRALRAARGAQQAIRARLSDLNEEHWVSALERHGVLPNYALLDDTVRLAARVSWRDPDSEEMRTEPYDLDRSSTKALAELAPGATFYAHGMEMQVDGVDLSGISSEAEWWFCCSHCGYVRIHPAQEHVPQAPTHCPRCADTHIADIGRARRVLRLTRVFADISRDDARISDTREDRLQARFSILPLADFDPQRAEEQWACDSGFGLIRYRHLMLRWLNTGRLAAGQGTDQVAGINVAATGFRLCEACGKLDTETGPNNPREHRPWCEYRSSRTEHIAQVDLMRTLETEALALILPPSFATNHTGTASLCAALFLGLRLITNSVPAHLNVAVVPHPVVDGEPGETRQAVLVHDVVPGGTGYLTDLTDPNRLWNLLISAGTHLENCNCRHENRHMCHNCLLPFAAGSEVSRAAAVDAIRRILGLNNDEAIASLDPGSPQWRIAEDAPARPAAGASPLEDRLRDELQRRLAQVVDVEQIADPSGAPALNIDGGRWKIRPQLDTGGSRPDFTCLPSVEAAPIAVFCDGWEYHASLRHNRLADDAAKRERLRARGYRVVSVAATDLDGPWDPSWLINGAGLLRTNGQAFAARVGAITDKAIATWCEGPVALLTEMLVDATIRDRGHEENARSALADAVWVPLLVQAQQGDVQWERPTDPEGDALQQAMDALYPAESDMHGQAGNGGDAATGSISDSSGPRTSASVFLWPHLALAVQLRGTSTVAMALVLDDSSEALASPDHRDAWLTWLRLGNVLPLANASVTVTTVSAARDELSARRRFTAQRRAASQYQFAAERSLAPQDQFYAEQRSEVQQQSEPLERTEALEQSGVPEQPGVLAQTGIEQHSEPEGATAAGQPLGSSPLEALEWNRVDPELTDPRILDLVPYLAARGIRHGADGEEIAGGIMADLLWYEQRVAVVVEDAEEDAAAMRDAGWHVVVAGSDPEEAATRVAQLLVGDA